MKIIIATIFFIVGVALSAQTLQIKGKVVDNSSHKGLYPICIRILNSTNGTISNESGEFVLKGLSHGKYVLIASGVGYEEKQVLISVKDQTEVTTITLSPKSIDLDQIVVTATRTERLLKDVPIQTLVISSKAIERMQTVKFRDLLEYELPGIEFTNNGGFANINMLGFGGKYVLFLVDGERMAGETFDNIDYNRIDMDNIQQIEIVKGASSSLYGSNAVGGVINIITKKPQHSFETGITTRLGSNNEQSLGYTAGSRQKWGYASIVTSFKSMEPYLLKDREPLTQVFETGKEITHPLSETYIAGYKDYSITPKIGVDLSKQLNLEVRGGYYFKERNLGGLDGYKVRDRYYNYSGGIKALYKISKTQHLAFSGNYDKYSKHDYYRLLKEKEKNYENSQWRFEGNYNSSIASKHSLVAGVEYFSDELMTFMFQNNGYNSSQDAQTFAIYSQQEWALKSNFTMVTGLRYDYHSEFKGHLTPRLSVMYRLNPKITFRGGYSGGFRSPTLKELYTDWFHPYGGGFQIIGNKEMKAEKSNNLNLSTEILLGKTIITVMGQYSFIDDMVSTLWINNDTVRYTNMGNTKVVSSELTISNQINNNIFLKGSYSFVHNNLGKKSVIRPHTATLRIDYTSSFGKKYNPIISFSGKYFSKMNTYGTSDITDTDNETDINKEVGEQYRIHYEAYSICRLTLAQPLPYNLIFNAGINNLFDYKPKFSSFYSSISPGRTYYISLKWKLK